MPFQIVKLENTYLSVGVDFPMGFGLHSTKMLAVVAVMLSVGAVALIPGETSPRAQAYLEEALDIIEARHINVAESDWNRIENEARTRNQGAQDTADTYRTIRWVLAELREPHSTLVSPDDAASGSAAGNQGGHDGVPTGRLVTSNVGWVELPPLNTFGPTGLERGRAYTERLKTLLLRLDRRATCGWIVDLRGNSGGNMWPMLNGLDPLLGPAPFGFFTMRGDARHPWIRTELGIAPGGQPAHDRPAFSLVNAEQRIAVLLGPRTMSSGEMVAIALAGRGKSRTFGAATAGYTTGNLVHSLPDGALLILTETRVANRAGVSVLGPIIPDEAVGQEAAPNQALAWLARHCAPTGQPAPPVNRASAT